MLNILKIIFALTLPGSLICFTPRGLALPQDYMQDQQVIGYRKGGGRDPVARLQQLIDRDESMLEYDKDT